MSLNQALQHLKIDGWYVMEGVIPENEVDAVRESVERSTIVHRNPNAPAVSAMCRGLSATTKQSLHTWLTNVCLTLSRHC